jgi:hypothetical protein
LIVGRRLAAEVTACPPTAAASDELVGVVLVPCTALNAKTEAAVAPATATTAAMARPRC